MIEIFIHSLNTKIFNNQHNDTSTIDNNHIIDSFNKTPKSALISLKNIFIRTCFRLGVKRDLLIDSIFIPHIFGFGAILGGACGIISGATGEVEKIKNYFTGPYENYKIQKILYKESLANGKHPLSALIGSEIASILFDTSYDTLYNTISGSINKFKKQNMPIPETCFDSNIGYNTNKYLKEKTGIPLIANIGGIISGLFGDSFNNGLRLVKIYKNGLNTSANESIKEVDALYPI